MPKRQAEEQITKDSAKKPSKEEAEDFSKSVEEPAPPMAASAVVFPTTSKPSSDSIFKFSMDMPWKPQTDKSTSDASAKPAYSFSAPTSGFSFQFGSKDEKSNTPGSSIFSMGGGNGVEVKAPLFAMSGLAMPLPSLQLTGGTSAPSFNFGNTTFASNLAGSNSSETGSLFSFAKSNPNLSANSSNILNSKKEEEGGEDPNEESSFVQTNGPPPPPKQQVATGEEDDEIEFKSRAKLLQLVAEEGKKDWKERGIGELHVNRSKWDSSYRMVLRQEGQFRVVLNSRIYPQMLCERAQEKSVRFSASILDANENSSKENDASKEGEDLKSHEEDAKTSGMTKDLGIFLLRFPSVDVTDQFMVLVTKAKSLAPPKSDVHKSGEKTEIKEEKSESNKEVCPKESPREQNSEVATESASHSVEPSVKHTETAAAILKVIHSEGP